MEVTTIMAIILVSLHCVSSTRHVVYWDRELIPKLSSIGLEINLEVDDYMDILCPYAHDVDGVRESTRGPILLQLFNVTSSEYMNCDTRNGIRLQICDDPFIEKKLTTKFQERSPNPYGFTFIPGATYYYLSKPLRDSSSVGCTKDTMKMMIHVQQKGTVYIDRDDARTRTYHLKDGNNGRRGQQVTGHKHPSIPRPGRHHHHGKTTTTTTTTHKPKVVFQYQTKPINKVYSPRVSAVHHDKPENGGFSLNRSTSVTFFISFVVYFVLNYFLCYFNELQ